MSKYLNKKTAKISNWLHEQRLDQNRTATLLDDGEETVAEITLKSKEVNSLFPMLPQVDSLAKTKSSSHKQNKSKPSSSLAIVDSPATKSSQVIRYKGIKITKLEQLGYYKELITLDTWENLQLKGDNLNLTGIVAKVGEQKVGLILANVSTHSKVAKTISLNISIEGDRKVAIRLMQCLEKSLLQQGYQRVIWHQQAKALIKRSV